jgi:hypothetical protein
MPAFPSAPSVPKPNDRAAPTPIARTAPKTLAITRGTNVQTHKIVVFGSGGVGKTELWTLLRNVGIEPLGIDLDDGSKFHDVARVVPTTWDEVRGILHNPDMLEPFGAVVVDSLTKAEELATAWTLENVKRDDGTVASSVESYGWGKGYVHVYESMLRLLGDLDAVARMGKHVVCVCHDCTANVPNPGGNDWIRYEPRLQSPPSGKASVRLRVKEWSDHMFFIGFDQFVSDEGKAKGTGTRTIYTNERPTHMAKSRTLSEIIKYNQGSVELWQKLFSK